jgi:hypothetical protein
VVTGFSGLGPLPGPINRAGRYALPADSGYPREGWLPGRAENRVAGLGAECLESGPWCEARRDAPRNIRLEGAFGVTDTVRPTQHQPSFWAAIGERLVKCTLHADAARDQFDDAQLCLCGCSALQAGATFADCQS